jgi:hypothetical protein
MATPKERPNVVKFYPYWVNFMKEKGKAETKSVLEKGFTNQLNRKDHMALLRKLGLREY